MEKKQSQNFIRDLKDLYSCVEKNIHSISKKYDKHLDDVWDYFSKMKAYNNACQKEIQANIETKERVLKEEKIIENLPFPCIGKSIEDFGHTGMVISNKTFQQCKFSLLRLKDCEVKECSITQCIIDGDSYLRHACFDKVDFTGTIFRNCNLEKASFKNCKLYYVKFENCMLDISSITQDDNLPSEVNLRLALYKSLYNNEVQRGNTDIADALLVKVMKEETKLYKSILFEKTDYFRTQRKGKTLKYIGKYFASIMQSIFFGYGFSIRKSILRMFAVILLYAGIYFLLGNNNDQTISKKIIFNIMFSIKSFILGSADLGIKYMRDNIALNICILTENILGLIYFAFFTSTFYRRISRR